MSDGSPKSKAEANQFYHELHNLVKRWRDEGDELSLFQIVGAMEAVKADCLDALAKFNRRHDESED